MMEIYSPQPTLLNVRELAIHLMASSDEVQPSCALSRTESE